MLPEPSLFKCGEHTCGLIQALEREGRPLDRVIGVEGRWEQDGDRVTQEEKVSRRWYLLVIGLLYIGLIISFCLNVTLLLRRGTVVEPLISSESRGGIDDLTGEISNKGYQRMRERCVDQSSGPREEDGAGGSDISREFAYTTACLVQGRHKGDIWGINRIQSYTQNIRNRGPL